MQAPPIDAVDMDYGSHLFELCASKAQIICRTTDARRADQGKTKMSKRTIALSAVAALTFAAIAPSTASAGSDDAISVPAVVGAAYNSASRADSAVDVQRQGDFATAGSVRWPAQAPDAAVARPVFNSPGVMGAMNESRSLARSAEEVARQGGFATAAAVHWLATAPAAKKIAAAS